MQDQLIGYLIGALQVEETIRIERTLPADAEARRQLEILRLALAPLEPGHFSGSEPPTGLALRTCLRLRELRRSCDQ